MLSEACSSPPSNRSTPGSASHASSCPSSCLHGRHTWTHLEDLQLEPLKTFGDIQRCDWTWLGISGCSSLLGPVTTAVGGGAGGPRPKDLEMLQSSFFYQERRLSEKIKPARVSIPGVNLEKKNTKNCLSSLENLLEEFL